MSRHTHQKSEYQLVGNVAVCLHAKSQFIPIFFPKILYFKKPPNLIIKDILGHNPPRLLLGMGFVVKYQYQNGKMNVKMFQNLQKQHHFWPILFIFFGQIRIF